MLHIVLSLAAFLSAIAAQAVLEPADGAGIYLGPWYDRRNGETPEKINKRFNHKPFSFFQSDMNITDTLQLEFVENFVQQVEDTGTDSFLFLTIYPWDGYDKISDSALNDLANVIKRVADKGRKTLLRFASEMNGSWFKYGQQPTKFIESWRKVYEKVKSVAGKDNVAMVWAPNSGNGYPFVGGPHSININSSEYDSTLDTNGDGKFDHDDDPYTPYYPGDEYVDWVGQSIYHYGADWFVHDKWITNDVPAPLKSTNILHGFPDPIMRGRDGFDSAFDFYRMFSGDGFGGRPASKSKGGKPFFVTETGSTVHLAVADGNGGWILPANTDSSSRIAIKQAWWRQMINSTFLQQHPKIKGIGLFEFVKFEEESWRDFTVLGDGTGQHSPIRFDGADNNVLVEFRKDLMGESDKLILWGNQVSPPAGKSAAKALCISIVSVLALFLSI